MLLSLLASFPWQVVTVGFTGLCLLLSLTAIAYYSFAIFAASQFFSKPTATNPDFCPPVSVLKPLCGVDSSTYDNLASFCRQEYPSYQIIFGIQDACDPSLAVVKQLMEEFPALEIDFVVSDRQIGSNLKVSNLANAVVEAKYDILVLADSDIWVGTDYLKQVIQPLQETQVGVVTCLYRSRTEGKMAGFEALSISTEFLPSVLVARQLEGMAFALGATIVIRASVLTAIGGFSAVANYLEDDFKLGNLPAQAGYQVVLSDYVVDHVLSTSSLMELIHHQTRWGRSTRAARPWGYLGLIFTHGTTTSLLFWLMTGASLIGWVVLATTWTMRFMMAWLVGVKYLCDPVAQKFFWLLPLRDLTSFGLWCYSFWGNTVEWRGRSLKITKGGKLADLTPKVLL
ncbi:MAG: bacteriohopanetetrol glucosamine biosynthesis glycosyltransferase HpnI [Scytolyngbya sp. HA4215-MV1]|jgi:ceramide glucosyltransferase|nr:bacteriohopanetetrol glucosamine biosynthesis glycosyltransferase HpnI [Scytolyngbya sp. HA4215-MV1]